MYRKRQLLASLSTALTQFPAVLITGPRQSGKTTFLMNELGSEFQYVSLDDPLSRDFAIQDPNGFLAQFEDAPVILDEIQYVPDILPYLKIRIDKNRRQFGQWVLTGSQQFALMQNVSESLAGRIALLELLPFSQLELKHAARELESFIWVGGYPEPALAPEKRNLWMSSYIQTYLERDVRLLHNVQDLRTFETFVALCAARHGQVFNKANLARESGVSEPTVKSWGGLLGDSYICFFLQPYLRNYSKRLVKTPKLYFIDPGLASALTRQPDGASALAGQMGGAFFEGMIIAEAIKIFVSLGKQPDVFFWRSQDGLEVDLLIQANGLLHPVEIKLTATPTIRHLDPLNRFKTIAGHDAAAQGVLVCRTQRKQRLPNDNIAMPWHLFSKWLYDLLS